MTIQYFLQQSLPKTIELLRQMVEINSYTENADGVNQVGQLTAQSFSHLGFTPTFIASENSVYGQHLFLNRPAHEHLQNPSVPTIAMISHLDTVFSPEEEQQNQFHFNIHGDKIYGPGSVDIKGGSVIMLMVLEALQRFAPKQFANTHWVLAFNASEEVLSDDFGKLLLERLPKSTLACLVFEGGTPVSNPISLQKNDSSEEHIPDRYKIVTARKGRATFQIQVKGRGAHSGNYHAIGANAVVQIAHTIQKLAELTDYEQQVTVNVGTVSGGSVTNRVPHYAEASVDMRAFSPTIFQHTIDKILSLENSIVVQSIDGFACEVGIHTHDRTAPWPENEKTNKLFEIWQKNAHKTGMHLEPEARGGLSDGNFLWNTFPTIDGLGPVGANAHCSESTADGSKEQEFALMSSFVPKALLTCNAILDLLSNP